MLVQRKYPPSAKQDTLIKTIMDQCILLTSFRCTVFLRNLFWRLGAKYHFARVNVSRPHQARPRQTRPCQTPPLFHSNDAPLLKITPCWGILTSTIHQHLGYSGLVSRSGWPHARLGYVEPEMKRYTLLELAQLSPWSSVQI